MKKEQYQVYEFDFVKREVLDEVLYPMPKQEARKLAEMHAYQWAGDEMVEIFGMYIETTPYTGDISNRPNMPDAIGYCSPESDFGTIVVKHSLGRKFATL